MKTEYKSKLLNALMALILVVLSVTGSMITDYFTSIGDLPPEGSIVALGTTHFTAIEAEDLTATDDLAVTDDSTLTDDVAIGGDLTLSGLLYPSYTNITVTNGLLITPTYTIYTLDSAAAVTITLQATGTEHQLLLLCGDDANTITINDTNTRSNDGAAQTIGEYDCILWLYFDAEWVEISESNNS